MLINQPTYIKTTEEIQAMKKAGKILGQILEELRLSIRPEMDVWELEKKFIQLNDKFGVMPSCKGYAPFGLPPFPTGLCLSINDQAVHCFPRKGVILHEGDIVTIDTDINYRGFNVDSAFATGVGKISPKREKLLETTKSARHTAIKKIKSGVRIGVISNSIQKTVEGAGFNVIRDYAGHGIGRNMHEYPDIPCYGNKNAGPKLKPGMTICIEPLVCTGKPTIKHLNAWETQMADKGDFCQFEHTVLVTEDGYEILTQA